MKRLKMIGTVAVVIAGAMIAFGEGDSKASSHREAPFITKNPKVDGTDFYMFNSYDTGRPNTVTLIANYQPLQDPIGGPNYFSMDPEAIYEIHIDQNADSKEDITFQFQFSNALANAGKGIQVPIGPDAGTPVGIPLVNAGPVNGTDPNLGAGSVANINVNETYTVKVINGNRRTGTVGDVTNVVGGGKVFTKPLDNIGMKTFQGGYAAYASQFIYNVNIPGCAMPAKLFAGQRKESFAVNLGTIFDLVNAPLSTIANPALRNALPNPIGGKNITSLAIDVPVDCLRTAATGTAAILGGWTTASVRQARVINPQATYVRPAREGGAWAQVSRLGSPLVNEVVIGLADKDKWNSSEPKDDGTNFATYVTNPTLPKLIELIFGAANAPAPTVFPRVDLVAAFLTGVTGVNANGSTSEMLRLNTALPATTTLGPVPAAPGGAPPADFTAGAQSNLGALGCFTAATATTRPAPNPALTTCDLGGFPNGRRPGDDTVDIALRVVMGALLNRTEAPAGTVPLHDAVLQDANQFDTTFPYLKTPLGGS